MNKQTRKEIRSLAKTKLLQRVLKINANKFIVDHPCLRRQDTSIAENQIIKLQYSLSLNTDGVFGDYSTHAKQTPTAPSR